MSKRHWVRSAFQVVYPALLIAIIGTSSASLAAPKKQTKEAAPAAGGKNRALDMKHSRTALPESTAIAPTPATPRDTRAVKPPRSGDFYDQGTKEAEYERLLDAEIRTLYKLSQQARKSPNRGEVWLRLGERYVEKARLMEMKAHQDYDTKLKEFMAKKSSMKPKLDLTVHREFNAKAVQLYEWYVKDFPNDPKVDQALFFLGYNQFELGNPQLGERYYTDLVKRFPESVFVTESHFALGEYYFENEQWREALDNYSKVTKVKKARLNTFALYKASWCLYRLNRVKPALQALERVVRQSRAGERAESGGGKSINKVRLAGEALKDYVPFYAEVGEPNSAIEEFQRVTGDEKQAMKMAERLAFILADSGNRPAAVGLFKKLIGMDPSGERAAEYQYQVVLTYATSDQKEFRKELDLWLEAFGKDSPWARDNAKNQKLVADVMKLQETTLRNHVLQAHQTAQNSRAPYSQQVAHAAYNQYFKYFNDSPKIVEMHFFHAELLYDMGKYEEAARHYNWVADKEPKGPYREKAIVNALLALEKDLPSPKEIDQKRGNSLEKMPLDPPVERFEKAAKRYMEAVPSGDKVSDIQRRLGVIYYSYNHFEEAMELFEKLVKANPKSENGEIAGNLILDIYKLKGDMEGLTEKGNAMLANPAIASTKFGASLKVMMEKATYIRAEKYAKSGDSLKAAKEFETFSTSHKGSELSAPARFKAAEAYEKGGDFNSAIRMHLMVLNTPSNDPKIKAAQNDSRNALARIYQQTGQLELAAKQYYTYATANPKDPKAVNAYYNAAILWDSLGEANEAMRAYQTYYDLSKKSDRHEILFAQAELQRKKGNISKASALYEQYLNVGPRNRANAITSAFYIAKISEMKGQATNSKRWYNTTVEMYKASNKQARDAAAKYAAEARFQLAQETLAKLMAVRFTANDKQQARAATDIKVLREKYIAEMKEVIRFDNGPYIVAALASGGRMFDQLATSFAKIPVPAGFNGDDAKKYKELIQVQINGFRNEAKTSYKTALDKAHELEAYTQWARIAKAGLASFESEAGGEAGELTNESRAADWMGL